MTALSSMTKAQLIAELVKIRDGRDATIINLQRENLGLREKVDTLEAQIHKGSEGPIVAKLEAKVTELETRVTELEGEVARATEGEDLALYELSTARDAIDRARVDLDYRGYCGSEPHRLAAEVLARALDS